MEKMPSNITSHLPKYLRFFASFAFFLFLLSPAYNQTNDQEKSTIATQAPQHKYFVDHNPAKAMWMSAALPGLGQYYNQKYWKIPIVYAGFSTLAYFSITNRQEYVKYRNAYSTKLSLADGESSKDPLINNYTESQLLSLREYYQANLELNYILFGVFYILQLVDATIDAHFYEYNIDDNLTIGIDPIIYQDNNQIYATPAVQLRWTLGKP